MIRYLVPLALIGTGGWFMHMGYTPPGFPLVISGLTPRGLAVDDRGAVYVSDTGNHSIWRVWNGSVQRVAGTGTPGFGGDGGPATLALLSSPEGLLIGAGRNLLMADSGNARVRQIGVRGTISTVAGNGIRGYTGDSGPASRAQLDRPVGLAFGPNGCLFIADDSNHTVRSVDSNGMIRTVAGVGRAGAHDDVMANKSFLWSPTAVAVNDQGEVFIADSTNHRIVAVETTGVLRVVISSTGKLVARDMGNYFRSYAPEGVVNHPYALVFDRFDRLFVVDRSDGKVSRLLSNGRLITIAGSGQEGFNGDGKPATRASLFRPTAVAVAQSGVVYVSDYLNRRVRMIDQRGIIHTVVVKGRFE